MDQDTLTKWLDALESKKYAKNKNKFLKYESLWSIKGVLCDITKHIFKADWIQNPFDNDPNHYLLGTNMDIPKCLINKLKISKEELELINTCENDYLKSDDFSLDINYLKSKLQNADKADNKK